MNWPEILKYKDMIFKIAAKYSNDKDLAEDVAQEVMLKLYEDKKLKTSKFDPKKKDAAIRNTIRNKTLKVLRSRKIGRWQFESLDKMKDLGFQIDDNERIFNPDKIEKQDWIDQVNEGKNGDNNLPSEERP